LRIVSGGQTGVDRGALDAAIELRVPHGGWCPRGRRAEDGTIPARYQLRETRSGRYAVRTRQNVLDSSGTLILCRGPLTGGTALTHRLAAKYGKPCLVVDLTGVVDLCQLRDWLVEQQLEVLNVAGPRESTSPGIAEQARRLLVQLLSPGDRS
jgi:hypothetical protein